MGCGEDTHGEHIVFPQLEELIIEGCPKLTALPEAPLLQGHRGEGVVGAKMEPSHSGDHWRQGLMEGR